MGNFSFTPSYMNEERVNQLKEKISTFLTCSGCLLFLVNILIFIINIGYGNFLKGFIIAFILFIISTASMHYATKLIESEVQKQRERVAKFQPAPPMAANHFSFTAFDARSRFAVDFDNKQFYSWYQLDPVVNHTAIVSSKTSFGFRAYDLDQVLAITVRADDKLINYARRSTSIAQALIDELIGPLTEKQTIEDCLMDGEAKQLTLTIIFQDEERAIQNFSFFTKIYSSFTKDFSQYDEIVENIAICFNLLTTEIIEKQITSKKFEVSDTKQGALPHHIGSSTSELEKNKQMLIKTALLPLLQEILKEKTTIEEKNNQKLEYPHFKTTPNVAQSEESQGEKQNEPITSSYFDEILKRNRDFMNTKNDEKS